MMIVLVLYRVLGLAYTTMTMLYLRTFTLASLCSVQACFFELPYQYTAAVALAWPSVVVQWEVVRDAILSNKMSYTGKTVHPACAVLQIYDTLQ